MSSINNNNNSKSIKSPKLQGEIVESILIYCINGISICELSYEIQKVIPLPYKTLKKYLFYLINYELLSYDGQDQIYTTEDGGLDLLDRIGEEKRMTMTNTKDIVITLE
jgi:predicted transcriptional regulator